jgi:quercetin dioxygenase-like cupin family protein
MNSSKVDSLGFYGGIFWRIHHFLKAGDTHSGHKHLIDHATLVSQGSVKCEIEDEEPRIYTAPSVIEINKDIFHKFTALEDNTVYFCVFATDHASDTDAVKSMLNGMANKLCGDCKGCE